MPNTLHLARVCASKGNSRKTTHLFCTAVDVISRTTTDHAVHVKRNAEPWCSIAECRASVPRADRCAIGSRLASEAVLENGSVLLPQVVDDRKPATISNGARAAYIQHVLKHVHEGDKEGRQAAIVRAMNEYTKHRTHVPKTRQQ